MSYVCGLPTVLPQSHTCGFCAQWEMYTCFGHYTEVGEGAVYLYTRVLLLGASLDLRNHYIYCGFPVRKFSVAQWLPC